LDVNGTGRFSGAVNISSLRTTDISDNGVVNGIFFNATSTGGGGINFQLRDISIATKATTIIKQFTAQTSNLTEWQNATGTVLTSIGANGALSVTNGVVVGPNTINASAILDVQSTTKGFLLPRITTAQRDAISSPATGLQIYNTTTNTNDIFNGVSWSPFPLLVLNRQTINYTLQMGDTGELVEQDVATANTITVPLNSVVPFAIGTKIDIVQYGLGQTTRTPANGVIIRSYGGALKITGQYGACTLVKRGTNEWYCFGNLVT
jgi:hypothetical protein